LLLHVVVVVVVVSLHC